MTSPRKRRAPLYLVGLAAALLVAVPAFAEPRIDEKRAQARAILAELEGLDAELGAAVERYNDATYRLDLVRDRQRVNAFELKVAKRNLARGQKLLAERLRALYLSEDEPTTDSTLEIFLGSKSLEDVLNRIDTVNRVSDEDAKVITEVKRFKREVVKQRALLKQANARQSDIVAQRAAARNEIEGTIAHRQRMLASVKDEIAQLQAEERARQAELARQAAARLAAVSAEERRALQDTVVGPAAVASADGGAEQTIVAPPSQYGGVVGLAMQHLGTPYVWGGGSPGGFDCSGLVQYVYAQIGVSLPHSSYALFNVGVPVSRDQLQAGDLVFFNGLGHMGIYIGNGQMIHAPHTGDVVKISDINSGWYASTYVGARRITG